MLFVKTNLVPVVEHMLHLVHYNVGMNYHRVNQWITPRDDGYLSLTFYSNGWHDMLWWWCCETCNVVILVPSAIRRETTNEVDVS